MDQDWIFQQLGGSLLQHVGPYPFDAGRCNANEASLWADKQLLLIINAILPFLDDALL
jgi:hypothetical protein